MIIYHYVPGSGVYCGQDIADESPLEPGVYLIPALATDIEPPTLASNQIAKFENGAWKIENVPIPPIPDLIPAPTADQIKQQKINDLDKEYNPKFDSLTLAWATAYMSGDTVTANARIADKTVLTTEYNTKKGVIENG
jgi:hypothetical protein